MLCRTKPQAHWLKAGGMRGGFEKLTAGLPMEKPERAE